MTDVASFNLWTEPWITLERADGRPERVGIEQALLRAHEFIAIYDSSPLVVVGIHRLLTAILQAIFNPQRPRDLKTLWNEGHFPQSRVRKFGTQYAGRFDLFSAKEPFLQSGDLPLKPEKGDKVKTVAYLFGETPSSTEITHYRHGSDDDQIFCPACLAKGLVSIPPFATAGGRGFSTSINGIPPIYVMPSGKSLFENLVFSLVLPAYQPSAASRKQDLAWWSHPHIIGNQVTHVGYLHSLTFPARRVRLHPDISGFVCGRCGYAGGLAASTMVFEMGEYRPKESSSWEDPFVAYHLPDKGKKDLPTPIRPQAGKSLWREFAGLFLQQSKEEQKNRFARPTVLYQLANIDIGVERQAYSFRCVGIRTDKAKVFEWLDAEFSVPSALLDDEEAERLVREATQFASDCEKVITGTFRGSFGGSSLKSERHKRLKSTMQATFWAALAAPFREFVSSIADPSQRADAPTTWAGRVVREGQNAFNEAAAETGDGAITLRQQVEGQRRCAFRLAKARNAYLPEGGQK